MKIEQIEIHPRELIFETCYKEQEGTLVFRGDGKERAYSFPFKPGVRFVDTRIVTANGEQKTGRIELFLPSLYAQIFGAYLGNTAFGWILNEPSEEELKKQFLQMGSRHSTNDKDYMCGIMLEAVQRLSKVVRGEDIPLGGSSGCYLLGGLSRREPEFYKNLRSRITEKIPDGLLRLMEDELAVEVGDSWDGREGDAPLVIYGDRLYSIEAKIFQPS